jgi:UDP-N-acetylmuramate dehydrogenase
MTSPESPASTPGNAPTHEQRGALAALLDGDIAFNYPLAQRTSMRVGGSASAYAEVKNVGRLVAALSFCESEQIAWTMIGLGSNLLVPDAGFPGAVFRLAGDFVKITVDGTRVRAGGAAPIVSMCREAANAGLTGAEALVGIPGTVGGAVRMNAGTDVEIGALVDRVEIVVAGERMQSFTRPEFAYRRSTLDRRAVVCAAELVLEPGDPQAIKEELRRRIDRRRASQPIELPNSGSIFRNPPGDFAARLIESAGCKGMRRGGAQVSEKHANFIVNAGGATCADVLALIDDVRRKVLERHAVPLELEVHVL